MYDSILDFITDSPAVLEEAINNFFADEEMTLGEMIKNIKNQTDDLARRITIEVLEQMDKSIKANGQRKAKYSVIRTDEKTLLSTVGLLKFNRCYYKEKSSGDRVHILDSVIGITSNTKKTEDVVERILNHACDSSYRISGEDATYTDDLVSKQTVMNVLRHQVIPDAVGMKLANQKKQVKYLFINADEDHVSLQFQKKKGDLTINEAGYKSNTYMPRLVYTFDGVEPVGKAGKRHQLVNRVCFTENSVAEKPAELWERVMAFIDSEYDYDYLEKIYLMGDGAAWIKGGIDVLGAKAVFVLDKFHLSKSIAGATAFLGEDAGTAKDQIWDSISMEDKEWFKETMGNLKKLAPSAGIQSRIDDCRKYILNHWNSIIIRNNDDTANVGCSAEGLVSHIFSDRLSSRPLGWSKEGANKMAQLRVFKANGGKVVDLMEYSKKKREIEYKNEMIKQYNEQTQYKRKSYEYALQGTIVNSIMKQKLMLGDTVSNVIGF